MSSEFTGGITGATGADRQAAAVGEQLPVHALLKMWDDWGERGTWRRAVAKFRAEDDTQHLAVALKALADVPPVTALDALAANARIVRLMTGWQWLAMRDARKDGATWELIGEALGVTGQAAQQAYQRAIEVQERYCAKYLKPGEAQELRALLNDSTEPKRPRGPVTWRDVQGGDLAEGMTIKSGGKVYTIKGITAPGEQDHGRRSAHVIDSQGNAGALAIYPGTYQVRND